MNIITALNNEKINKELNKIEDITVVSKDIQYKEGILELLEKNNNIQYIFIKENLCGQIPINNLINKIINKNNKINIIILNKKETNKKKEIILNKKNKIYLFKENNNK